MKFIIALALFNTASAASISISDELAEFALREHFDVFATAHGKAYENLEERTRRRPENWKLCPPPQQKQTNRRGALLDFRTIHQRLKIPPPVFLRARCVEKNTVKKNEAHFRSKIWRRWW